MKKCVLTGAGGFIGFHTVDHFMQNTDWDLYCVDSFRHKGKTDRLAMILDNHPEWRERIHVYTHDLIAPLSNTLTENIGEVDYVINMASDSHVDRSIDDPVPFVKNNVDVALNMLEYAREVNPEIFIQISTDEVYGAAPDGVSHIEWSTLLPSNPYAASKAAQESISVSYWRSYGVPVVITNTMNNIGETQDPEKFVPLLISKIYNGETVPIHGSKDRVGSRYYLHARNHADGLLHIINNTVPSKYSDADDIDRPDKYNLVGELELNNLELAQMVAEHLDKELNYKLIDFHSARPGHDRRYALDGGKMWELGWVPPVPFHESLKKTIEWTVNNPIWMK